MGIAGDREPAPDPYVRRKMRYNMSILSRPDCSGLLPAVAFDK